MQGKGTKANARRYLERSGGNHAHDAGDRTRFGRKRRPADPKGQRWKEER
jgi:hypothetical protein